MKFESIIVLGAAAFAVAEPHAHNHARHHPARHAGADKRDMVTVQAPPVIATVYEVNGKAIPYSQVEQGLQDGYYVIVPDPTTSPSSVAPSTSATPTSTSTPTPTPSSSSVFIPPPPPTSTSEPPSSTYVAPPTSASPSPSSTYAPPALPSSSGGSSNAGSGGSTGTGLSQSFKSVSGQIPCSSFPSEYGPVYADWLELGGYTGVQQVPGFVFGVDAAISYISTGSGCTANSFCSYACPAGYQKSQWPTAQGATGQSIGGLWCNAQGFLELSNPTYDVLCIEGTGSVQVSNKLGANVCVCRTDYPGTESETIALNAQPGQTYPLTCPSANTYYKWENAGTSAQYYINPSGLPASEACTWNSAGSNAGNWAPVNAGVGQGTDGVTYLSLFQNAPTNPSGTLDYTVTITGDVSDKCVYSNGKYTMNGVDAPHGCTVGVTNGGQATFEFS